MSTVIIFATILFNGIVENLEYKVGTFSNYEECTEEVYDDFSSKFGHIDWDKFQSYEKEDNTQSSQTFACSGDSCEIVDIGS